MLCSGVKIPNVRLSDNREREKYSCTMNLFTALKHDFSVYVTKKIWIKWQTNIAHFERNPFQYRSLTQAIKMHNNWRENLLFGDWVHLVNSDSCNLLPSFPFWSPFVHSLDNHDLGLQYTISQLPLLTASFTSSPIIAADTPILFKCSTQFFMMAINEATTTIVNGILSCLHSNARFIWGNSWKIRLFPKPVKLRRHLSYRLRVLNSFFALRV